MRGQDHVVQATQRAFENVVVRTWLDREHVDGGADQVLVLDRISQGVQFDDRTASGVDQDAALLHCTYFFFADHPLGFGGFRNVQSDDVGHAQQLVQAGNLSGVAQWKFGQRVVEVHLHAQAFSQNRQLSTNRAVADDAQLLATDLEGVGRALDPAATVAGSVLLGDAAQQQDRLGQHQFGDRTGVGVRRVEHRDTAFARRVQINLVGADAEAADRDQFLGAVEQLFGQLSAGTDADEVSVGDLFLQLGFRQRLGVVLDAGIAGCLEDVDSGLMNAFEKKELDLALVEGSLAHLRKPVSRRKWQGVAGSALGTIHGGRMLAYEARETPFQNVNRSQDAHELSES
ncbi:Uncharacterized protein ALO83_04859 [Pseudomonas cannabina pv. alisalensis]|uniref:Uncharacterized protein n=1 Tax=Pseudomonas cannabina TaxID=86840 RepID=A0A3M3QQH5_PSECA|nr:Uncharacterized protein ALO83_04859 [Pseudomonas cannabina pv. alisalensis]RMN77154.1 hypothetical protein ALQ52_02070 [Pseudomonas cannabina pv. alisalensis]RMN79782.1 hypothetical protein ALQ53_04632 [Pseudomonas cannabina]RMN86457.1 hypothetical protein ALQ51_05511 [Pseudomonas cannabina]